MKQLILLLLPLFACTPSITKKMVQEPTKQADKIVFPRDFIGNWEGTLMLYSPVKGKFQEAKMQLNIRPLKDSIGQYTFQLVYGEARADNRPYRLVAADSTKQHWIIDENDGIKLDGYFIDDTFMQIFTVEGSTLTCSDRLKDGVLYHEIIASKQKPIQTSGGASKDVPTVESYPILSTQKAILKRKL